MNIKLYAAARVALHAKAVESLALIDVLLENPTMVPDHTSLVDEIARHACRLAEYEGAMITLEQYFAKKPAPQPQAAPTQPSVTEEQLMARSEAYRNSPPGIKKRAAAAKKKDTKKDD
jgi:hypothetical protein